jgi:predicted RNA-binding protein YlqC (UPF0109 family)
VHRGHDYQVRVAVKPRDRVRVIGERVQPDEIWHACHQVAGLGVPILVTQESGAGQLALDRSRIPPELGQAHDYQVRVAVKPRDRVRVIGERVQPDEIWHACHLIEQMTPPKV